MYLGYNDTMAISHLEALLEPPLLLIALLLIALLLIPLLRVLLWVPPISLLRVPAIPVALVVMVVTESQNPETPNVCRLQNMQGQHGLQCS